jgi:hypothetical protein
MAPTQLCIRGQGDFNSGGDGVTAWRLSFTASAAGVKKVWSCTSACPGLLDYTTTTAAAAATFPLACKCPLITGTGNEVL